MVSLCHPNMWTLPIRLVLLAVLVALASPDVAAAGQDPASLDAWRSVVQTTQEYKASLERLLVFHAQDVLRATELAERRREFFERGIVARRDLEESVERLEQARARAAETRRQIVAADMVIAEAVAHARPPAASPSPEDSATQLTRFAGNGGWSLTEAARVQAFFTQRFGHPLPVSAWGQTPIHDRLGFDHRNALDVAVHPDSPEGQALTAYLRSVGIPFIAVRAPVPGTSTGAHIHVGPESHRLPTH